MTYDPNNAEYPAPRGNLDDVDDPAKVVGLTAVAHHPRHQQREVRYYLPAGEGGEHILVAPRLKTGLYGGCTPGNTPKLVHTHPDGVKVSYRVLPSISTVRTLDGLRLVATPIPGRDLKIIRRALGLEYGQRIELGVHGTIEVPVRAFIEAWRDYAEETARDTARILQARGEGEA